MKRLILSAIAGVLVAGTLCTLPDTALAQRETPLPPTSRMHPDTTAAPLQGPPGGAYKKVSTQIGRASGW